MMSLAGYQRRKYGCPVGSPTPHRRRTDELGAWTAAHGGDLPRHVGRVPRGLGTHHSAWSARREGPAMTGGVIIAYVALLVIVGLYSARQVRNESDYLVAGRRLGPIVLGATLPATQLSAGTAIGTVGYIALYGYQYNWFWIALWTGWLVSMLFVAPKMHEFGRTHGGMTIPD